MAQETDDRMDKLVALCKRRGFIFQSSEIYGGIGGFWDYGPLGVELKRNVKAAWWEDIVRKRDDIVGLDCSIIMNPKVWEASGHLSGFHDPMVTCKGCKRHMRADQLSLYGFYEVEDFPSSATIASITDYGRRTPDRELWADRAWASTEEVRDVLRRVTGDKRLKVVLVPDGDVPDAWHSAAVSQGSKYMVLQVPHPRKLAAGDPCPNCGGELTEPRQFNLMFKSHAGAMEDSASVVYLRPETAQGIFANYKNVLDTSRMRLPFGIAQIGKAFRNEINPRNYTFRSREFEQMEIEFFCHPKEADEWYTYWRDARFGWYVDHGLTSSKLRLRDHEEDELAHYAKACADVEYEFPFGVSELEGIANRTDFDLTEHQKHSGRDMTYYDDQTKERFIPYVIEPSGGIDRTVLAFLCEAYAEDEAPDEKGNPQKRTVMRFHPRMAPVKVAVFPLVRKEGMPEIARGIYEDAQSSGMAAFYDEKGAVGRRYRRQDEAGTPFCVTVDGRTLEDQTVTIRDRDSLAQERIAADKVVQYVQDHLG